MLDHIHWLGHAAFRLDGPGVVVYFDPRNLKDPVPADVICVTHGHFDHLSVEDLGKVARPGTVIVCPASCVDRARAAVSSKVSVRSMASGQTLQLGTVTVETVPSYNTNKPNHPRNAGNLGFVVEMGGQRVYFAGDTDFIPEMADIRCDVALLPVGGTYTMNADEAAQAAAAIKPKYAVPMHWGEVVGSRADAERFVKLLPQGVQGVLLPVE
jgi:L-ascorbate metabolism protein UlaG (beta-lactamase superfamily)